MAVLLTRTFFYTIVNSYFCAFVGRRSVYLPGSLLHFTSIFLPVEINRISLSKTRIYQSPRSVESIWHLFVYVSPRNIYVLFFIILNRLFYCKLTFLIPYFAHKSFFQTLSFISFSCSCLHFLYVFSSVWLRWYIVIVCHQVLLSSLKHSVRCSLIPHT